MRLPITVTGFLWHFVKKQKGYFLVTQIMALAWSLDNTAWPYAFKLLIDKMTLFSGNRGEIWHYLIPTLVLWILLWITIEIMFRAQGFLMSYVLPRFEANIRLAMFDYVSRHSYDFFANNLAGNISNKISDMTASATRIITKILILFIPVFVAVIVAISVFASINIFFSFLILVFSMLHVGICFITAKKCSRLSKIHAESRSRLTGKIVDSFSNIINVKLFAKQRYELAYMHHFQEDERRKHQASQFMVEKIKIALGITTIVFPGILMTWYVIYSWQQNVLTIGDVVLIFNMTSNLTVLTWMVSLEMPSIFTEIGICQQALSIIKAKHDIVDRAEAKLLVVNNGGIIFDDVTFYYTKANPVFSNLSIKIEPGTKVGLVGFSGSGKSTFVNLIMRFFELHSGQINIDGIDISTATLDSLRGQISMIPQNPSLFHRSLRENICYGKATATENEILVASKQAHCHEFICKLPKGYDSLVGERGIKLSGGQRQRVAIARAILENQPILVLDEATSALDSITENYIQDALHFLMKGRTTIVIAHRLSTLSEMTRILVFDNGQIVEDGDHNSLLRKKGHYAKMWNMQAGGFLPNTPDNK